MEKQSEYSVSSALEDMTTAAQALSMTESHQASLHCGCPRLNSESTDVGYLPVSPYCHLNRNSTVQTGFGIKTAWSTCTCGLITGQLKLLLQDIHNVNQCDRFPKEPVKLCKPGAVVKAGYGSLTHLFIHNPNIQMGSCP